jgi:hypothetical protein
MLRNGESVNPREWEEVGTDAETGNSLKLKSRYIFWYN